MFDHEGFYDVPEELEETNEDQHLFSNEGGQG